MLCDTNSTFLKYLSGLNTEHEVVVKYWQCKIEIADLKLFKMTRLQFESNELISENMPQICHGHARS